MYHIGGMFVIWTVVHSRGSAVSNALDIPYKSHTVHLPLLLLQQPMPEAHALCCCRLCQTMSSQQLTPGQSQAMLSARGPDCRLLLHQPCHLHGLTYILVGHFHQTAPFVAHSGLTRCKCGNGALRLGGMVNLVSCICALTSSF